MNGTLVVNQCNHQGAPDRVRMICVMHDTRHHS